MKKTSLLESMLIVDPDASSANMLSFLMGRFNVSAKCCPDAETALREFELIGPQIVVIDQRLPDRPGMSLIQKMKEMNSDTGFVLLVGNQNNSEELTNLLTEFRDIEILYKPLNRVQVPTVLGRLKYHSDVRKKISVAKILLEHEFSRSGDLENVDALLKETGLDSDTANLLAVDFFETHGLHDRAYKVAIKIAKKNSRNLSALHAAGRLAMRLGRLQEAKVFFERANVNSPGHIDRLSKMAELYLSLKEPAMAIETMEKLMKIDPRGPEAALGFYVRLQEEGHDDFAKSFIKSHSNPTQVVRFFNNKGVLLSKRGRKQEAIKQYVLALKAFPSFRENYRILFNYALALCQVGGTDDIKLAKSHIKDCLTLRPDFEKAERLGQFIEKRSAGLEASLPSTFEVEDLDDVA